MAGDGGVGGDVGVQIGWLIGGHVAVPPVVG